MFFFNFCSLLFMLYCSFSFFLFNYLNIKKHSFFLKWVLHSKVMFTFFVFLSFLLFSCFFFLSCIYKYVWHFQIKNCHVLQKMSSVFKNELQISENYSLVPKNIVSKKNCHVLQKSPTYLKLNFKYLKNYALVPKRIVHYV